MAKLDIAERRKPQDGKIRIMPGGGIKPETFEHIYDPQLTEYHLSGRVPKNSSMPSTLFEMDWFETSAAAIARVAYRP
jgi:copper homeostasis protein CutC